MQAGDVAGSGTTTASTDSPELLPRAWYHPSEDLKEYYDVDIGVAALRDFLADQKTPFDVRATVWFQLVYCSRFGIAFRASLALVRELLWLRW